MKIVAFSGSLREGSYNSMALRNAVRLAPQGVDIDILYISNVPLYNADLHKQEYPVSVKAHAEKIKKADGLLIASPEYSGYFTGVLKNFLDWMAVSKNSPLVDKHVAVMGVSNGHYGSDKSQQHLKSLAIELNMKPFNRPKIRMYNGAEMFDENGVLKDERFAKNITKLLEELRLRIESDS